MAPETHEEMVSQRELTASRTFEVAALIGPDARLTIRPHRAHRCPINWPAPLVGLAGQTAPRRLSQHPAAAGALLSAAKKSGSCQCIL